MAWIVLAIAGLLEIVWAFAMKQSMGFTRFWPSTITLAGMLLSFGCLAWAMRSLPLGTAYAVWTGIGALGAFLIGIAVLGEPASLPRIAGAGLILAGIILLKLSSPS